MMRVGMIFLFGGASCIPDDCDPVSVSMDPAGEEYRDLPVLASGDVSLLGLSVPDSHARAATTVAVSGAPAVEITSLSLAVTTGGTGLDVRVVRWLVNGSEADSGASLPDGATVEVFFRARQLTAIAQPTGAAYSATMTIGWRYLELGCASREGTTTAELAGAVRASADTGAFAIDTGGPVNEARAPAGTSAQMRLSVSNTSGSTANLSAAAAQVTYIGADGLLPGLGLALFDGALATQVAGQHATSVANGARLTLYSSTNPGVNGATYGAAGTAATTGTLAGGKALINVTIDYDVAGTPGVVSQTLVHAVDIQ